MNKPWLLLGLLAFALAACVPGVQKPEPPQARVEAFRLESLDPFTGKASFALRLRVRNPNAFELPLLASRLTLSFDRAQLPFDLPATTLPAAGFQILDTQLEVPLADTAEGMGKLLRGEPLRLRLSGKVRAQVGPVPVGLGPLTLLDENVRLDFHFAAPHFELEPAQSRLRIAGSSLEVAVGFRVANPNPVGFYLKGPVGLLIAGQNVAEAALDLPLLPRQTGPGRLVFRVDLAKIPGAAAALATGLPVELNGALRAEVPGVWQQLFEVAFGGRVR